MKTLAKYHKWISIIFSIFIILFSISGIILNHRNLLSRIDINRSILPDDYSYDNWNNAAVRSTIKLSSDSILIYGNIGIWLTDSTFDKYQDFNMGFPKGIDNRKVSKVVRTNDNQLLAGTLFGLFKRDKDEWNKLDLPVKNERISDLLIKNDSLFILTRSFLLKTNDLQYFEIITIPDPENYDNKIGLFKTLWVIHSGEIYGEVGKIIVDIVALILMFLTITGLYLFMNKLILKKSRTKDKVARRKIKLSNKFWLKWHNKIGWTTVLLLIITSTTGIFLRPPFLIPIANAQVSKIPFSELDTDNAWFDKLRRILYDEEEDKFILSTSEGMHYSDDNFNSNLKRYGVQPPVSVMGLNVFEKVGHQKFIIGSFEGLFLWDAAWGDVVDIVNNTPYQASVKKSRPIGQYLVSGYSKDFQNAIVFFDYNTGAQTLTGESFPSMPEMIRQQPMSLWNVGLEVHTARFFQNILDDFYILIVPLTGIALLFILISGVIVWYNRYRK